MGVFNELDPEYTHYVNKKVVDIDDLTSNALENNKGFFRDADGNMWKRVPSKDGYYEVQVIGVDRVQFQAQRPCTLGGQAGPCQIGTYETIYVRVGNDVDIDELNELNVFPDITDESSRGMIYYNDNSGPIHVLDKFTTSGKLQSAGTLHLYRPPKPDARRFLIANEITTEIPEADRIHYVALSDPYGDGSDTQRVKLYPEWMDGALNGNYEDSTDKFIYIQMTQGRVRDINRGGFGGIHYYDGIGGGRAPGRETTIPYWPLQGGTVC